MAAKVGDVLAHLGAVVPDGTPHREPWQGLPGQARRAATRLTDPGPSRETPHRLRQDGATYDPASSRWRVVNALRLAAVWSLQLFLWLRS
jgi:hypothetical protein